MEKPKNLGNVLMAFFAILVIVVVSLALFLTIISQPKILYPSEVRDYLGENLSSIANVLENAIKGIQYLNRSSYRLNITGQVDSPLQLTYNDVLNNYQRYQKVVTIQCVEGWQATILWEGFLVKDLLQSAGANMSSSTAIFYASDGYSTALPMNYIINNNIIIAYKMNNLTIPPERGFPFELVAESQSGYKWIKWLTRIDVSDNAGYLGYWESRGYPNNALIK